MLLVYGATLIGCLPPPSRLDPDHRISREHIRLFGQQNIRIIFILCQRHHFPEFLQIFRMFSLQNGLPQAAVAPELDLLFHQPPLNLHISFHGQIRNPQYCCPDFIILMFFNFSFRLIGCPLQIDRYIFLYFSYTPGCFSHSELKTAYFVDIPCN